MGRCSSLSSLTLFPALSLSLIFSFSLQLPLSLIYSVFICSFSRFLSCLLLLISVLGAPDRTKATQFAGQLAEIKYESRDAWKTHVQCQGSDSGWWEKLRSLAAFDKGNLVGESFRMRGLIRVTTRPGSGKNREIRVNLLSDREFCHKKKILILFFYHN